MGWRPNLYVVARFLDALHERPRTRSELQAAAGVNYDIFRRYVAFLEERGFVVSRAGGELALTAAGGRVRDELRAWIERFLEPERGTAGGRTLKGDDRSPAPR